MLTETALKGRDRRPAWASDARERSANESKSCSNPPRFERRCDAYRCTADIVQVGRRAKFGFGTLERDDFPSNRHPALSFCLSVISAQTLRVCREGKPVPTHRVVARGHAFPDHALICCFANRN